MTETKTEVPAIYTAIATIRKDLPTLSKNGTGPSTQGGYKFLSIDDILTAVRPLEVREGVISYPVQSDTGYHYNTALPRDDGRKPSEAVQAIGTMVFRYVAIADGSHIDVEVPAEAMDTSDKATRKYVTQAQKIANITLYNIITGEPDPDSQDGGAEVASAPNPVASKVAAAREPRTAPKREDTPSQKIIREKYVDTGKVTQARAVEMTKTAQQGGLKGEDAYAAVLKILVADHGE